MSFLSVFLVRDRNFFSDGLARRIHETRRDRDGLVSSRLFSRRDRLVTGPSLFLPIYSVFAREGPAAVNTPLFAHKVFSSGYRIMMPPFLHHFDKSGTPGEFPDTEGGRREKLLVLGRNFLELLLT